MADLIITAEFLEESATKLETIRTEFEHIKDHSEDDLSIWGHAELRHAMKDFNNDWWVHRKKMSEAMESLHKKMDDISAGFTDTETALSDALDTETTSS